MSKAEKKAQDAFEKAEARRESLVNEVTERIAAEGSAFVDPADLEKLFADRDAFEAWCVVHGLEYLEHGDTGVQLRKQRELDPTAANPQPIPAQVEQMDGVPQAGEQILGCTETSVPPAQYPVSEDTIRIAKGLMDERSREVLDALEVLNGIGPNAQRVLNGMERSTEHQDDWNDAFHQCPPFDAELEHRAEVLDALCGRKIMAHHDLGWKRVLVTHPDGQVIELKK